MFIVPVTRRSADFSRQLERLFDDGLERLFNPPAADVAARTPALDVSETERGYTVLLDLPGVGKQDVQVNVEGRRVSVSAQAQQSAETATDQTGGVRVLHRERSQARYERSFTLPADIDQTEAQARLDNGVLTLELPKRAVRTAAQITIN